MLRALALRSGMADQPPSDRAGQRALWEAAGVIVDDLASQVLVLNLPAYGPGPVADWINGAAEHGLPFRLTLQQQVAYPITPTSSDIFVCENPAILRAAAAELGPSCAALVCTEGIPSAACHRLLSAAARAGARLHWRADFDWVGLRIVGDAVVRHGAAPWRMSAANYAKGPRSRRLHLPDRAAGAQPLGRALAAAMHGDGQAVMEERLLLPLLDDVSQVR